MTKTRAEIAQDFLDGAGWADATRAPLAGDASNRRYERLNRPNGRAVLMDAPIERGENIEPFIQIANHLRSAGLSAPEIYAADLEHGFCLLEDLGDDLFARVVTEETELSLYSVAVDALIQAQETPAPDGLPNYGPPEMIEAACLFVDWYVPHATQTKVTDVQRAEFRVQIKTAIPQASALVMVQRDYHAENLLWMPERAGAARVGLLDFQDAALGHPAYDLASLLRDARRDVSAYVEAACVAHYLAKTGWDRTLFEAAYNAVSAQRNLRILGVFTRLCVRDGKQNYPDLMPRVWANLMRDLDHPDLAELRKTVLDLAPEPSAAVIARIQAAHG